mgnify:FL=1
MLSDLNPLMQKLIERKDLTVEETEKAFKILEAEDIESRYYYKFLEALHNKQETSDELLGFCKANKYFVPKFQVNINPDKIIDLSGTGGDKIKTPNISTIASFIVASKGIYVAKQSFLAVTGITGSANILQYKNLE